MADYYISQGGSRILNATRVDQSGADNTNVIDWTKTNDFIIAININSNGKDTAAAQYKLRWRNKTDAGSFADVGAATEINYNATTDLVNGNPIAVGGRKCDSQGGDTWAAGEEVEGASLSDSIDLADEYETEIHFALDCSGATDEKEYEFELYDSTLGVTRGTCGATITMAAGSGGWLSGWSYRKEITVTGQSGAGTNYQVDFSVGDSAGGNFHLEGHCTNFPQDIIITDNDGTTLLDFWIEDITADPLKMWVEVSDDLGSNQTIYIYYGKIGETTDSSGVNTFPFFDDFNNASIDTAKWNTIGSPVESGGVITINSADEGILGKTAYGLNYAVRGRCNFTQPSTGQYGAFGWSATLDGATPYEIFVARPTPTLWALDSGSNYSVLGTGYFGSYHIYEVTRISTSSHKFLIDDSEKWDSIASSSANLSPIFYLYDGTITHTIDWTLVRKYIATEPAFSSAGSEETSVTQATTLLHGKIRIKDTSTNLADGKVRIQDIATNLVDGKVAISLASTDTGLTDGKVRIQDIATNLVDGKIQLKDIDTDTVDGLVKVQDIATDITDGKVQVLDVATGLTDGLLIVQDKATGLIDSKVQVQDTATNLVDGKVIVSLVSTETDQADGKIQIKDSITGTADGLLKIIERATSNVDGKLKIKDTIKNLADGLIRIKDSVTGIADGKIQIKDVTTNQLDGLIKVKDTVTGLADGKVKIGDIGSNLADGLIRIKDSVTGIADGKVQIKDVATGLTDGKVQVQDTGTNLADGKVIVSTVGTATGQVDGKIQIKDVATGIVDGLLKIGVAIRRISIGNLKPSFRLITKNQKPSYRLVAEQPKPTYRLETENK